MNVIQVHDLYDTYRVVTTGFGGTDFTLTYGTETTSAIPADASEQKMRRSLEALSKISTVRVERTESRLESTSCDLTVGSHVVTCQDNMDGVGEW